METVDDYVDLTTPAVGANGVDGVSIPMPLGHHHGHVSDPSMSSRDGDSSDPDHDEESGEELPQQPLHETKHSISSDPSSAMGMPTPISQLSNLMAHHPHFLSKLKNEPNDVEMTDYHKQQQSGIEALQAVMSSANFNMPFPFPPPAAFLNPNHHSSHAHTIGSGGGVGGGGGVVGLSGNSNNPIPSSASSHSSESSQGSARNISDAREGSNNAQNNNGSQQSSNWSFEEQFKQVRQKNCELLNMSTKYGNTLEQPKSWCDLKNQPKEESSNPPEEVSIQLKEQLYEINDDPKRKEFLDELFSFMQSRGTPINRLPIMAKSVLDLHELYNLVVIRGGLVKVIEKKLWQEIIKGLSLPSSITSAAFTLRTQYMKYLYTYECEKHNFSSPSELQAAIDGNRREGRRSSYTAFSGGGSGGGGGSGADNSMSRNSHGQNSLSLHAQMSPLALVGGQHLNQQSMMNGGGAHTPMSHHPHGLPGQPHFPGMTGLTPEMESHMLEYFKIMNADAIQRINAAAVNSSPTINRHGSTSPTSKTSPREGSFAASDMRASFPLWNLYNNNNIYPSLQQTPVSPQAPNSPTAQAASPEPQREALDLGLRSSPISSTVNRPPSLPHSNLQVKKERDLLRKPNKRPYSDDENITETPTTSLPGTHIKIVNNKNGENSLAVSMELNGVMYEGVLLAQTDRRNNNNSTIAKGNLNGY